MRLTIGVKSGSPGLQCKWLGNSQGRGSKWVSMKQARGEVIAGLYKEWWTPLHNYCKANI